MAEWMHFIHALREDFGGTRTERERAIVEAPDQETARKIMEEDPTIASGIARGEPRPFRAALLHGRD